MKYLLALSLLLLVLACADSADGPVADPAPATTTAPAAAPPDSAQQLLDRALVAHGGHRYERAAYAFTFREKTYTFRNDGGDYRYTVTGTKDGREVRDTLANGTFTRTVDGRPATLTAKELASGTEAINSVIYFATLPHKLRDPAVNLAYGGRTTIGGREYAILNVSFDEEGGGTDYDDNFRYWINAETDRIDYLAYDYRVNGGGVRFRTAYEPRLVEGILFQNYVNYKAPLGTALADLPRLWEAGELEELSRIETEAVEALR